MTAYSLSIKKEKKNFTYTKVYDNWDSVYMALSLLPIETIKPTELRLVKFKKKNKPINYWSVHWLATYIQNTKDKSKLLTSLPSCDTMKKLRSEK